VRLLRRDDHIVAQFTFVWEVEYLAEQEGKWVPFALPTQTDSIGEIHASTHEIRLLTGITIAHRQVVVLQKPQ
jgi:hypothetical protein